MICPPLQRTHIKRDGTLSINESIPDNSKLCPYKSVMSDLRIENEQEGEFIVLSGTRLLIPQAMRRELLDTLHSFHNSGRQMSQTANKNWYWPHMAGQIEDLFNHCDTCQEHRMAKERQEPQKSSIIPLLEPMMILSLDFFSFAGFF